MKWCCLIGYRVDETCDWLCFSRLYSFIVVSSFLSSTVAEARLTKNSREKSVIENYQGDLQSLFVVLRKHVNMNRNIKSSISRKALHRLSIRRRSKVMSEIRSNLRAQKYRNCITNDCNNIRDTRDSSCQSNILNILSTNATSDISDVRYDTNR